MIERYIPSRDGTPDVTPLTKDAEENIQIRTRYMGNKPVAPTPTKSPNKR